MTEDFGEFKPKKKYSLPEALAKIYRYCAYQERSHQEVKNKLYEYGLYSSEVEETISRLISEGFLNEERFAKAFAGGKFRIMKWGKHKIERELQAQGLTKKCISIGLKEVDDSDYRKTLKALIRKKSELIHEENTFKKKDKVARYVIGKGYEPELVWEMVKNYFGNS
ncbi:MAG: RecX family transcriptional regulator [Azospira oryzae]|jgi:regulatory protein|nr:RecX family transcriptional regulator [Cytophaga sp.]PZR40988.1 MAG: RecX family transcriptional regulator [Azospira oryzae]